LALKMNLKSHKNILQEI